jgi:rRNA maturation endonuclease Nob1
MTDSISVTVVTLLRCACGDKEVTKSWVPADMCGRCGMPLRRVKAARVVSRRRLGHSIIIDDDFT